MIDKDLRYTGTKIKSVLTEQGRRQDWLAAKVGVSPAAVNRWIRGSRTLERAHAEIVAQALDIPFDLLFDVPIGTDLVPFGRDEVAA